MKCISILDVKTNSSLKVKIRTLVITSYEASSNSKSKAEKEEQASSMIGIKGQVNPSPRELPMCSKN